MLFVEPAALTASTATIGSITATHTSAEAAASAVELATMPPGLEPVSAFLVARLYANTAESAAVLAPAAADQLAYGASHTGAAVTYTAEDVANAAIFNGVI
ncbi:PE domain-containing protein [Tsukamurella ocularis]|uniref:PE domain-containing protein n=1 Tax=Tsukamurella ocularis TaxID=1970234 RepID=UPI00216A53C4|nr:PE domain-containing protein [Tsukamurella ocularis]MCS3853320.1 hypothetical protein [Tsukamurella ocularis]